MSYSMFDLFKVGIGPSSSHTVGPMLAGFRFAEELKKTAQLHNVKNVRIELFGSLALTGKGHNTDSACIVGLMGEKPDTIAPGQLTKRINSLKETYDLPLGKHRHIRFDINEDLIFHFDKILPEHPNGISFTAIGEQKEILLRRTFFSVGGGFVVSKDDNNALDDVFTPPHVFSTGHELLRLCKKEDKSIADLVFENELAREKQHNPNATSTTINNKIDNLWQVMENAIKNGIEQKGDLPGELKLKRRANELHNSILDKDTNGLPQDSNDWVNLYAMAVSEENAAGGRIVTSPTNGAAGVIPAVIGYYNKFVSPGNKQGIRIFLATAAAIGSLYKINASIAAAEVGCQGEIGVACSMAAAGLAAAKGGTVAQIENAAEVGMEHNLGLTCDPIGGLVQIPCIERNTMGAVKAINAARLALRGNGHHYVSLDNVIKTMHETGKDMETKYKETSLGGLAKNNIPVNIIDC